MESERVDTCLNTQTGGRIKRIQRFVGDEPLNTTCGDGVSDIDLPKLIETHKKSGKTVTLSAIQPGGRFGVLDINEREGAITGFREKAKEDGAWINAGFMAMEPEVFDYINNGATVLERTPLERLSAGGKPVRISITIFGNVWTPSEIRGCLKTYGLAAWRSGRCGRIEI